MQRYEREVEELLRNLGCDFMPDSQDEASRGPGRAQADDPNTTYGTPAARRSAGGLVERLVGSTCILLAMALVIMPFVPVLSAVTIVVSLALLLISLRQSRSADKRAGDGWGNDLRWTDVIVHSRPREPGTGRNPDDYLYRYK